MPLKECFSSHPPGASKIANQKSIPTLKKKIIIEYDKRKVFVRPDADTAKCKCLPHTSEAPSSSPDHIATCSLKFTSIRIHAAK